MLSIAAVAQVDVQPENSDRSVQQISTDEVNVDGEVFKIVDVMPEFPGGQSAMYQYLATISYPPEARENDWQGTCYIQFVVGLDGALTEMAIARSSGFEILDSATMAHIRAMPNWSPGMLNGKPVRVQYVIPIKFKLSGPPPTSKTSNSRNKGSLSSPPK